MLKCNFYKILPIFFFRQTKRTFAHKLSNQQFDTIEMYKKKRNGFSRRCSFLNFLIIINYHHYCSVNFYHSLESAYLMEN